MFTNVVTAMVLVVVMLACPSAPQLGGAAPTLRVTTTSLPTAYRNTVYKATLSAIGGTQPYSWKVTKGKLPPGLWLQAGGTIVGAPYQSDCLCNYGFTVQVMDAHGLVGQLQVEPRFEAMLRD